MVARPVEARQSGWPFLQAAGCRGELPFRTPHL